MKIGIVTVLYNCDEVLDDFFKSLDAQKNIDYILYVIDNGTTNSGTLICENLSKKYNIKSICVFNDKNNGVAKGNNQGIELALSDGCDAILLANNDTFFEEGTIEKLQKNLSSSNLSIAVPKIMYFDKPNLIWYAGGDIDEWRMRTPHYEILKEDIGQLDQQKIVGYAPTCFMLIHKEVFENVGLMDERYFVYYDDTDFVYRTKKTGYKIGFAPESQVFHKVSSSTGGGESLFSIFYTNRNRLFFIRKNLHGMRKISALIYFHMSAIIKFKSFDLKKIRTIIKGVRLGWGMELK